VTHVLAPAASELLFPGPGAIGAWPSASIHQATSRAFDPLGSVDEKIASQEHLLNGDLREVSGAEGLIVLERGNW
jgi:hypothetical protein